MVNRGNLDSDGLESMQTYWSAQQFFKLLLPLQV